MHRHLRPDEEGRLREAATRYLIETNCWSVGEFRVEVREIGSRHVTMWGIWLSDERAKVPGGGRSVELQLDRASADVRRELRLQ